MNIPVIVEKDGWDDWAREQSASFLQSWEWGEILRPEGKLVERLAIEESGERTAQALVIYHAIPWLGTYALCPKGPVFKNDEVIMTNDELWKTLVVYLKSKGCIFFRVEPTTTFYPFGFAQGRPPPFTFHQISDLDPRATVVLDVTKSDEALFAGMRKTTRHDVRKAREQPLVISHSKDVAGWWRLLNSTASRDGFSPHAERHYQAILNSAVSHQLSAYHNGELAASAIFVAFGDTLTYLFAASDYAQHNLLAPYRLQWEAIQLARKLGLRRYDLFGIAPSVKGPGEGSKDKAMGSEFQYDPRHRYAGITRFKLGFGGAVQEDPGTFDIILTPAKYGIYRVARAVRHFR